MLPLSGGGNKNRTPLHQAIMTKGEISISICQWLIEKGADVNQVWTGWDKSVPPNWNNCPLILAAKEQRPYVFEMLVKNGADVNVEVYENRKLRDFLKEYKQTKMLKSIKTKIKGNIKTLHNRMCQ